jgi:DNA-binding NarL/FixJ family response regulator
MIKLLVVHPARLIGSIYAAVLDERPDLEVSATATTVDEAKAALERDEIHIALVAAALPEDGALFLTRLVAERYPAVKVLITGVPESRSVILHYVMAGAAGYILQDVTVERLLESLHAAQAGDALVSPRIAAALITHLTELADLALRGHVDPAMAAELTPREREVLQLVAEGKTNQEIADGLVIEVGTVKNHVHSILKKLEVSSRQQAAIYLPFLTEGE